MPAGALGYGARMALPTEKLGTAYDELVGLVDGEQAMAYARATNDDNPAYASGRCAPPVFGVVPTWPSLVAALTDMVPAEAMAMVLHGEQDLHFAQPLVPGQRLRTRSEGYNVRPSRTGTRYTVRVTSTDDDSGAAVLEQYVTLFIRGMSDGAPAGPDKPDHAFPSEARDHPVGTRSVPVELDQTIRYSEASGDRNPIHVDDELARSLGLPGRIVHGLCTLAMASRAVVELAAAGDPCRLRRLAVRFSGMVSPGRDLDTEVFDAGPAPDRHLYAFETSSGGRQVLAHGRAEVEA